MQNKKIRINGRSNIVTITALLGLGSFVAQMLEWRAFVSALFACSLVCVAANYCVFVSNRNRIRIDDIVLFWVALMAIMLSDWQLNFAYYKPAIIVLLCVLCFDQCAEMEVSEKSGRLIARFLVLVCVITNGLYYSGLRYDYYGSTSLVHLNLGNPNAASMWLVILIILLCESVSIQKGMGRKLLSLANMISLLPILNATGSRNSLLAILFFFVGKLGVIVFRIKRLPKWVVLLITLAPVLVYLGYMYIFIPHYERFSSLFLFLISEGKPLTARADIWSDKEMNQVTHILFGNYTLYGGKNLHNSMVTLFCGYGGLFTVIVFRKLFKALEKMPNASIQIALSAIWMTGCFEASIFMGIAGMYMLVLLLPVFHQSQVDRYKTANI